MEKKTARTGISTSDIADIAVHIMSAKRRKMDGRYAALFPAAPVVRLHCCWTGGHIVEGIWVTF
jgi:hypothetical protein